MQLAIRFFNLDTKSSSSDLKPFKVLHALDRGPRCCVSAISKGKEGNRAMESPRSVFGSAIPVGFMVKCLQELNTVQGASTNDVQIVTPNGSALQIGMWSRL